MRKIETTVYTFNELSDAAKEKARDWYREHNLNYEWYDGVYEDFKQIAPLMGIAVENIYFSGFCSQGDGACFVGSWQHEPGIGAAVRDYAPTDETLHGIADDLERYPGLNARVSHRGHYYHSHSTQIDVCEDESGDNASEHQEIVVRDALRDLMNWLYRSLEREHDYLQSDEAVDESIIANEYEFTDGGKIV